MSKNGFEGKQEVIPITRARRGLAESLRASALRKKPSVFKLKSQTRSKIHEFFRFPSFINGVFVGTVVTVGFLAAKKHFEAPEAVLQRLVDHDPSMLHLAYCYALQDETKERIQTAMNCILRANTLDDVHACPKSAACDDLAIYQRDCVQKEFTKSSLGMGEERLCLDEVRK